MVHTRASAGGSIRCVVTTNNTCAVRRQVLSLWSEFRCWRRLVSSGTVVTSTSAERRAKRQTPRVGIPSAFVSAHRKWLPPRRPPMKRTGTTTATTTSRCAAVARVPVTLRPRRPTSRCCSAMVATENFILDALISRPYPRAIFSAVFVMVVRRRRRGMKRKNSSHRQVNYRHKSFVHTAPRPSRSIAVLHRMF